MEGTINAGLIIVFAIEVCFMEMLIWMMHEYDRVHGEIFYLLIDILWPAVLGLIFFGPLAGITVDLYGWPMTWIIIDLICFGIIVIELIIVEMMRNR